MDPRIADATELRKLGESFQSIAKRVHADHRTVRRWVKDIHIDSVEAHIKETTRRNKIAQRRLLPGEARSRIVEMRRLGKSYKEIHDELGFSKGTISYWCTQCGLTEPIKRTNATWKLGVSMAKEYRDRNRNNYILDNVSRLIEHLEDPMFTAGISWYMAEGSKRNSSTMFCNQDPNMILFMRKFFMENFPEMTIVYKLMINDTKWKERNKCIKSWEELLDVKITKVYRNGYRTYGNKHGRIGTRRKGRRYIGVCHQYIRGKNSTYVAMVIMELWKTFVKDLNLTPSTNGRSAPFQGVNSGSIPDGVVTKL